MFANRLPFLPSGATLNNCGATKEVGEPDHFGATGGASVWWSWTATTNGGMRLLLTPQLGKTLVAVYTGDRVDQLVEVSSGRDQVLFYARAETTYSIALDTAPGDCGQWSMVTYPESAPSNDRFADRLPLVGARVSVSAVNEAGRSEPGEPPHAGFPANRSLWWSWTAPETGEHAVSLDGYAWPPRLAIYTGDRLDQLQLVAARAGAVNRPAQLTFRATAGRTYAIAADSVGEYYTALKLALRAAAANDHFADAEELAGEQVSVSRTTFGATRQAGEQHHGGGGGASVWFRWVAPETRGYGLKVSMPAGFIGDPYLPPQQIPLPPGAPCPGGCEPQYAALRYPVVAVYRGEQLNTLERVAEAGSDGSGQLASLSFAAARGEVYFLAVDSGFGIMSDFTLNTHPGAPNDLFANATPIRPGQTLSSTTEGATREAGEPRHAGQLGGSSLWWKWTATNDLTLAFGADVGGLPLVAVYTGASLADLTELGSVGPPDYLRPITFRARAGVTYYFAVDELQGRPAAVSVSLSAAPRNDDFARRLPVSTGARVEGTTYGATHEPDEPDHGNSRKSQSIWWTWTAPATGSYAVSDGRFSEVYVGETLANLARVPARKVPLADAGTRLEFDAQAGTPYHLVFDTPVGRSFGLSWRLLAVPLNDHFTDRVELVGPATVVHASLANATHERGEPDFTGASLWWSWTAPQAGVASVAVTNRAVRVSVLIDRLTGRPPTLTNLVMLVGRNVTVQQTGAEFATTPGVTYYLALARPDGTNAQVDLTLSFRPALPLAGDWHSATLHWDTSPLNPWFRQTETVFDPPDAAQSGQTPGGGPSTISASVSGPGRLSFWWKVSAGTNRAVVRFIVGPTVSLNAEVTGERDWTRHSVSLGPGPHTLRWSFLSAAGSALPAGTAAWLDRVEFVPDPPTPARLHLEAQHPGRAPVLRLVGEPSRPYRVQLSNNLREWADWTTVVGRSNSPVILQPPFDAGRPAAFFRAVTP
ncbi:MAG: hypothetical protein HYY24_08855 [Verrucomicrobia bacterium]|nr:hypothetical protein [Verrucomicrobiota bacterium]